MSLTSVLVVCALDAEAVHLCSELEDTSESQLHGWRVTTGRLGNAEVDLLLCDIGMVTAAASTAAALAGKRYRAVLNYGCAGGHRDDVNCGDVVIGERVLHLGTFIVDPEGGRRPFGFDDETGSVPGMDADPELLDLAIEASSSVVLPPWPDYDDPPAIRRGAVGSADVWTQHPETIGWLHRTYGTLCEDMEAAAIAEVCEHFDVPFLSVKDISNNELAVTSELNPEIGLLAPVEDEIGKRAAMLMQKVIESL